MTDPGYVEAVLLTISLVNVVVMLWLGLTVLINAERRTAAVWIAGVVLLAGGGFFILQAIVAWRGLGQVVVALQLQWPLGWFIGTVLMVAWYAAMLWHAGLWEENPEGLRRRHLPWLIAMLVLGAGVLWLSAMATRYPWDFPPPASSHPFAEPAIAGVPILAIGYPLLILLSFGLALDALGHPAPSPRPTVGLARRRARGWLVATSAALLLITGLIGGIMFAVALDSPAGALMVSRHWLEALGFPALGEAPPIVWADIAVTGLIMLAMLFLGQAIVSYEIFTGKSLPRGGLKRHWYAAVLLAGAYALITGWSAAVWNAPFYGLMLATLLITVFLALLSWSSYVERDRFIGRLRPFVASQRVYDALLLDDDADVDPAEPFRALCAEVLGARTAHLVAIGSLAQLVDPPLSWPERATPPADVSDLAALATSPEHMSLPADPDAHGGALAAVPLWSERGLIGLLLLGEKRGGGLYTREEVEIARAVGERLIDTVAVARMSSRLMALQRRRLAEDQVVDRRTRRVLHDEVLPKLHSAMLSLSLSDHGADEEIVSQLGEVHAQVSDLLHEIPLSDTAELDRLGLVGMLRKVMEDEFADAFDGVEWRIQPDAEGRARSLPEVSAEVVLYAAREAIRNAARHGRGADSDRPLRLSIALVGDDELQLTIEDDGVGTDVVRADQPGHGVALHSTMMAVIGGSWATESAPGEFTRVRLLLPWTSAGAR